MAKQTIEKHLNQILDFIEVSPEINIEEDGDAFRVTILGDDLNFLIGYRGESLDALQYILSHAVFREMDNWVRLSIDINGYRNSKLEKIEEMVRSFVDRVRFHQKEMRLPPLSPFERRHVHTLIGDYVDIESESRGDGRNRRLFLKPTN